MNIIIPAAGQGARFAQDGYATPKPLINVLGEPMIFHVIRSLKAGALDTIHIVYTQDLDRYSFRSMLKKEFPDASLHFILLKYRTRGPVETVLCGLNQIGDLDNQVLVLDCDTFYLDDILGVSREEQENFLFYFTDTHPDAIFSYIQIKDGRVSDICEKEKISDHACTGAYGFRSGRELKKYCERVLNSENKARGEYYISSVYAEMINDGAAVISYPVENFHCLGTPQQLQTYCAGHGAAPKRFCFDLDGTLVTFPETPGDYRNAQPIVRNIRFVQYLHKQGHTIIIQTARKMLSSQHNAGQAARLAYQDVFATLEKYEIPFDEIYFGKPFAHFYIDDLSVKPFHMEQETGFYNTHVEARHFNRIEYRGSYVIKTTSNPGEVYWYRHIPESVRDHFPKVLETQGNRLTLEWIDGIVFSYLLVNNSLTRQNIGNLLETVGKLHTCAQVPDSQIDYNANYNAKMWERYQGFDYRSMSRESECYYKEIADRLAPRAPVLGVIHGDLVFSNIFLCDHQQIKFIDMRGRVGDVKTIFGDVFYDYAKIYQSLLGYDFIHNDCEINETYLGGLRDYFEESFVRMFYESQLGTLKTITACLLFSLIPLHRDADKQKKYFKLMEEILR